MTFLQQRDHVGVRKLPKFRVMRSDSEKRPRGAQANDLADLLSQFLERVLGCDRDREDDFPCSGPSDSAKRGAYRAAGGDPDIRGSSMTGSLLRLVLVLWSRFWAKAGAAVLTAMPMPTSDHAPAGQRAAVVLVHCPMPCLENPLGKTGAFSCCLQCS